MLRRPRFSRSCIGFALSHLRMHHSMISQLLMEPCWNVEQVFRSSDQ